MDVGERHYRAKALFGLSPFRPNDAFVGLVDEVEESRFGEALRAPLHRRQQRNKLLRPNPAGSSFLPTRTAMSFGSILSRSGNA